MSFQSQQEALAELRDPYAVLGISKDASEDQIKQAYRKMALKHHPDKNRDVSPEIAQQRYIEVQQSYQILSDPEKKRKYDAGGFKKLDAKDINQVELDTSQLGTVNKVFAAMFSKMGIPIRTTVSTELLEMVQLGRVECVPLPLNQAISDQVDNGKAHLYLLELSEMDASKGVCVTVSSDKGHRVKLLLFDKNQEGEYSFRTQVDSSAAGKSASICGLYSLDKTLYELPAKILQPEHSPEDVLFRQLDGLQPRETVRLEAGVYLIGVYGDNFFKKSSYTVRAMVGGSVSDIAEQITSIEQNLVSQRDKLKTFEVQFKNVQAEYIAAVNKFTEEKKATLALLQERDDAYLKLHGMEKTVAGSAGKVGGGGAGGGGEGRSAKSGGASGGFFGMFGKQT